MTTNPPRPDAVRAAGAIQSDPISLAHTSLVTAPYASTIVSGGLYESFPRYGSTTANMASALASGTLMLWGIGLPAGATISAVTFYTGTTALGTGTHQWAVLTNSARVIKAVSPDDTSNAWAADSAKTFTFSSNYTIGTTGLHYVGLNVTATTVPSMVGVSSSNLDVDGYAPIMAGSSNTGNTGTLSLGGTCTALTVKGQKPYFILT